MHDLRAAVYVHLQRMSLAFFTRTRTGEVQSRIANDIGGVDNVVTSTATSIVQNVDHRGRDRRRDVPARAGSSRSSRCCLMPFFVWLTRRVGEQRRADHRRCTRAGWPTSPRWSRSRCRSRASCSARRWAARPSSCGRFRGESDRARRPRGAQPDGRALADGLGPDDLRDHAGARLLVRRRELSPTARTAISIGPSSPSRRCRRGCSSRSQSLLSVSASTSRPRSRCSAGSSSTSTCRSTSSERPGRRDARARARRRGVRGRLVPLRPRLRRGRSRTSARTIPAGTTTALVGETGSGKTTLAYLVARLYEPQQGAVTIDGIDIRDVTLASLAATVGLVSQETYLFHAIDPREPRLRKARRHATRRSRPRRVRPRSTI